ncbi:hypothetical protein [Flavobacterium sp.]|uniref:hypothetical protein n=1 Tax=Flavobacterium sp. TaxID=239 RepID=UPI003A9562BB
MSSNTKKFLTFITLLCIIFVLADIFLWVNVANTYETEPEMCSAYMRYYPDTIRNTQGLVLFPMILLIFASLYFIRSARTNFAKIIGATFAALLAIFLLWKMFSFY